MATGWLWEERYAWFDAGTWNDFASTTPTAYVQPQEAFENPETKRRFRNLLDVTGVLDTLVHLRARPATDEEILRVHTPAHLAGVRVVAATGGDAGDGTAMGRWGDEIAALAAGGTIVAADAVLDGAVANAYALVRPPGHHAEPGTSMGFCVFSNIGIAIRHAQQVRGVGRVAVVDWDVHHGNGTETIFLSDPDVLSISLHQDEHYPPGRGRVDVVGEGAGRGTNLNIPLPPGSGIAAYGHAFERVVVPALRAFRPELIIVASGFDASAYDPLGRMDLNAEDFRFLTAALMEVAAEVCDGRLMMSHEGGYSSFYVPYCGLAVLEQMSGQRSDTDFKAVAPDSHRRGPRPLEAHERAAVDRAAANVELVPGPLQRGPTAEFAIRGVWLRLRFRRRLCAGRLRAPLRGPRDLGRAARLARCRP